ncbi:MAG TPA: hypothetical protein VGF45_05565, partial [Polyangia bacterium]
MSDFPNRSKGISAQTVLTMAVVSVVGILVLPLPPAILDAFLALNTAISVLVLLIALSVVKP